MNLKYLSIGVKVENIEEIESGLIELGIAGYIAKIREFFMLNIEIVDNRNEFTYAKDFLKKNSLEDENPFFNEFDITQYGLKIDFEVMPSFRHLDILEPMVFILGQRISSVLETECIVMFDNMRVPVGLFNKGILIAEFEKYNSTFFANKVWHPKM